MEKNQNTYIALNILALEDSMLDFEIIREHIVNAGFNINITRVERESEFELLISSVKYDIILTDFYLPGFNAFAAIKLVTKICPDVPVICLSGAIGEETAIELMKQGAVDYILKDRMERLPFAIKRAIEESNSKISRRQTEEALKENNTRLELAMDAANMAWWEMNIKTGDVKFEKRKAEMLGYAPKQFKHYTDFMAFIHPDDYEKAMNAMRGHLEGILEKYEVEYRIKTKTGHYKWFYDIGSIVNRDSQGKPINVTGLVIDISERKRAEDAMRESEEKYKTLIEISQDAIIINQDYQITYLNPAALKLFGAENPNQIIGKSPLEIFHSDYHSVIKQRIAEMTGKGIVPELIEEKIVRLDGKFVDVEVSSTPFILKGQRVVQVVLHDITERKQTEIELREKEVQYRNLANSGMALIWTSGADKLCNYFNDPWLKFTGRSFEQEMGNGWTEGVHPDDFDKCLETYVNAFDKQESFEMEYRLRHASGEYRWITDMGSPNYNTRGEFIGYIGHCFDISQRKELEEIKQESINELKKSKIAALNLLEDLKSEMQVREKIEADLIESKNLLENVNKHQIEIREEERATISREIHDQLGQSMTALKMDLVWLQNHKLNKDEADQKMNKMNDLIASTIRDIQRISSDLRPGILDDLGLASAIEWYCEEFADRTGLAIQTDVDNVQTDDPKKNITIYRVLQESLTNIIRHAKAKNAVVKLGQIKNEIELIILDDGIGIKREDVTASRSLGILGMIERVKQCNGKMHITTPSKQGTKVNISIPI